MYRPRSRRALMRGYDSRRMPELYFVLSPGQNWFFREVAESLCQELRVLGLPASVVSSGFPRARYGVVYALFPPHEFVALEGEGALPWPDTLARTIYICAEQPGSVHFEQNVELARQHPPGALFDINARSVALFAQRGMEARHLRLGYSSAWDHFDPNAERGIDVAFLGAQTFRRLDHLRRAAHVLSRRRCDLRISDNSSPNSGPSSRFMVGEQKWDLLTRARVLLNIHQGDEPYFEWLRIIDAIHCGAAVVSEHSIDHAPLVAGEHFLAGRPESLPLLVDALLDDEPRRQAMSLAAYELLRDQLPMRLGAVALRAAVGLLADRPLADDARPMPRVTGGPHLGARTAPMPHAIGDASTHEQSLIRRNLRDLRLDTIGLHRRLARAEAVARSPDTVPPPSVRVVTATAGWRGARPRVTAVVPLYNQVSFIRDALDSLVHSINPRQLETVIVNDGSTDGGRSVVIDWMQIHESAATLLVEHPINRGLPHARNTGIDFARGRYCLMLDADNTVYPRCVPVLADALDWNSELAFCYCMLECFGYLEGYVQRGGTPVINQFAWEPERLARVTSSTRWR